MTAPSQSQRRRNIPAFRSGNGLTGWSKAWCLLPRDRRGIRKDPIIRRLPHSRFFPAPARCPALLSGTGSPRILLFHRFHRFPESLRRGGVLTFATHHSASQVCSRTARDFSVQRDSSFASIRRTESSFPVLSLPKD